MTEDLSNRDIANWINGYWAERGAVANARVELKTIEIPSKRWRSRGQTHSTPGYKLSLEVVVSDTLNGWPVVRTAAVSRRAA